MVRPPDTNPSRILDIQMEESNCDQPEALEVIAHRTIGDVKSTSASAYVPAGPPRPRLGLREGRRAQGGVGVGRQRYAPRAARQGAFPAAVKMSGRRGASTTQQVKCYQTWKRRLRHVGSSRRGAKRCLSYASRHARLLKWGVHILVELVSACVEQLHLSIACYDTRARCDRRAKVGITQSNLGAVHDKRGELSGASACYARALRILESRLGSEPSEVGTTLNNPGAVQRKRGELSEASACNERSAAGSPARDQLAFALEAPDPPVCTSVYIAAKG